MTVTGVVVAGGRSTRFGEGEKALAELGGQSMLRRVTEVLAAVADRVVVNCRPDQQERFAASLAGVDTSVRFALDERPDEGPLAGLRTALSVVETDLAVVLACDMPLADPDLLRRLIDDVVGVDAAVPRRPGGPEPLHAVYRVEPTRAAADAALSAGERSFRGALDRLDVRYVDAPDTRQWRRSLTSVDSAERLRELAAAFEDR
ncbi:molybdenum cofactor guanylyltransferase [Haloarcula marina]|uniref:molybdenum cofactor guanylyltransferase n=1 Tax=Haloarcula marina TaxID=2961574 RepID=UPI0020B775B5|nr:molybdenum cofactor guanylyltransferase [Halomicroarcula marina]